ncbi:bile acid:sodium symporter [Nesterenkonia sandarakina]|uniref:ACR3 family arsenite efflux pump ArsB n=1 Tax=Nesterenkonia sandarakina TaxID=272918 RepID=A0A2T0YH62_9MICC|nr:bile acid:sodium symporter [Nesterenkonia sandarakina]PRZ14216.1 ACR3 family arsenite efflux pump ArsB [Nesterenkonia sandarakina]
MRRETLERHQVWVYLGAVAVGLISGSLLPGLSDTADALLWPVLALLLYATFTQVPMASVPAAFTEGRFIAAALLGNFVLLPAVVWALIQFIPADQALQLGLLLVLLVPCTDWFITFSQLGSGDATRATALTPVLLVLQLLLLPLYLWLMADADLRVVFAPADVWPAFVVVLLPLGLAVLTELWAARSRTGAGVVLRLGWWPVPLLAVVVLLVAVAQVGSVLAGAQLLPVVLGVVVLFLGISLLLSRSLAGVARLDPAQGRTLAFSMGTRNSFIVLPLALALPAGWETVAIVVVMQSLVELLGMIFCLWFVPRVLFPDPCSPTGERQPRVR